LLNQLKIGIVKNKKLFIFICRILLLVAIAIGSIYMTDYNFYFSIVGFTFIPVMIIFFYHYDRIPNVIYEKDLKNEEKKI